MRTLEQLRLDFTNNKILPIDWLGDSLDRFETYATYASKVDSIAEFGVYTGLSTTAWLSGSPKKLVSYDITDEHLTILPELVLNAQLAGIDFKFIIGSSLEVVIDSVDLLFVDTVHKKKHCLAELTRHAAQVKKYIIFHDTTAWPGVFDAVTEFLTLHPEWHIIEHCTKNSGLTVIQRHES
jgi:predicted O-methyltransferase YrrM